MPVAVLTFCSFMPLNDIDLIIFYRS